MKVISLTALELLWISFNTRWKLFSFIAVFLITAKFTSPEFTIASTLLVFIHELGHAVSFSVLGVGLGDSRVLPLFGGVKPIETDAFYDARSSVLMGISGPAAIALFAISCLAVSGLTGSDTFRFIGMLAGLASIFDILPFLPMDMGRMLATIAFGKSRKFGRLFLFGQIVFLFGMLISGIIFSGRDFLSYIGIALCVLLLYVQIRLFHSAYSTPKHFTGLTIREFLLFVLFAGIVLVIILMISYSAVTSQEFLSIFRSQLDPLWRLFS